MRFCLLILIASMLLTSCVPESKKILTEVELDVRDKTFQSITDHEYNRNFDSLYYYLRSENPTYRFLSARAFASLQSEDALDSLYNILNDPIIKVRAMAAHAIGQTRSASSEEALISGFRQKDTMSTENSANAAIIEAMGKISDVGIADYIIDSKGYRAEDTLLLEAKYKSIYQFGLRNIVSPKMISFAVEGVRNSKLTDLSRLYAAHYIARSRDLNIEKVKFQIAEALVDEKNLDIKMALATALRNTNDKEIEAILLNQLALDQDYRVKCNIIHTLNNYEYISVIEPILEIVKDENPALARCACQYIARSGNKDDVPLYREIARQLPNKAVAAELYGAIMSRLPFYYSKTKNATRWQIQEALKDSLDKYTRINFIHALGNDPESYPYLIQESANAEDPVINTAIIEALGSLIAHKDFDLIYKGYRNFHRRKVLEQLKADLLKNDEGITGAVANIIANQEAGLKPLIDSTEFLIEAKNKLKVPGQIESVHAVERALAHLRGVNKATLTKTNNSKLPDWSLLSDYSGQITAIVKTSRGPFSIDLDLEQAPGACLNFLNLIKENYFDDKVFHRVVPNFVIQTGSPRGDNYGGADYTINSNVAQAYYKVEGKVGMASAGLHTESTQWFVTHSPTPHLDGKYTIFGTIVDGMEVVHMIEVGDQILDIIITSQ